MENKTYKIGDGLFYCPNDDIGCPYYVDCLDDPNAKTCALENAPMECDNDWDEEEEEFLEEEEEEEDDD